MGQIVLIAERVLNPEVNAIDDIVEIQDDDVELTGSGYENFKIIKVEGKTKAQLQVAFKRPEQKRAIRVPSADKWCFMEEKEVWKNTEGNWCDLITRPKYAFSMKDVSEADRTSLADSRIAISTKNTILDKVVEKIHLDSANNIEVRDLNPVAMEL